MARGQTSGRDATENRDTGGAPPLFTRFAIGNNEAIVVAVPTTTPAEASLSSAERQVFDLVRQGHSDAEIAGVRGTVPRTVHKQVHSIYRKLGVASRSELLARY